MQSIYWLVMTLAAREPAAVSVTVPRGIAFAQQVMECAEDASPIEQAYLVDIGHHESRWDFYAKGDGGLAIGGFQLHPPWRRDVPIDQLTPCTQVRLALNVVRYLRHVCGEKPSAWLGAYASGKCGGAPQKTEELYSPVRTWSTQA